MSRYVNQTNSISSYMKILILSSVKNKHSMIHLGAFYADNPVALCS